MNMQFSRTAKPVVRRGGAVIIIVLALMAALAFLGFFFYEFTVFERSAAERYANIEVEYDPTAHFDDALEQVIVGTRNTHADSALWGNKYSLLATLIGRLDNNTLQPLDLCVHSGGGVRVRYADTNNDGIPDDSDGDSIPDEVDFLYEGPGGGTAVRALRDPDLGVSTDRPRFNLSRAADGTVGIGGAVNQVPDYAPDAGYTYPDINSMFLSYETEYVAADGQRTTVYIPSFLRPQYFLDRRVSAHRLGNDAGMTRLYSEPLDQASLPGGADGTDDTRAMVLRPHTAHERFNTAGVVQTATAAVPDGRFVGPTDTAAQRLARSGDTTRTLSSFTFDADTNNDLIFNGMGVFHPFDPSAFGRTSTTGQQPPYIPWDLDIDCDGDGVNDGILMDLDLPIVTLDDGSQVIPLVSFKIIDADGLLNLNSHGNQINLAKISKQLAPAKVNFPEYAPGNVNPARNLALDVWAADRPARLFGTLAANAFPGQISASGFGRSPYEINPAYALSAWAPGYYASRANLWTGQHSGAGVNWVSLSQLPHSHMFGELNMPRPTPLPTSAARQALAGQTEMAQMEFFMLLNGHTGGDGFQRINGRHGEAALPAVGTPGSSTRLQPLVSRDTTRLAQNSLIPGAGLSFTNSHASDDDRDHIGTETWIDDDLDGVADPTDGDGVMQADEFDRFNATAVSKNANAAFDNGSFDQGNAIASGDAYVAERLGGFVRMPPNVHPTADAAIADPFIDSTPATPAVRALELKEGRDGLALETAVRWPWYSENGREWYTRNYLATQLESALPAVLQPLRATVPAGGFVLDLTQQASRYLRVSGVVPYAAGAVGLTDATSSFDDLFDLVNEENEQIVGEASLSSEVDALFDPVETAALHLSDLDYSISGLVSRVRALAPINFDIDPQAAEIRKRFTTESHDRLEIAITPPWNAASTDVAVPRHWEFNRWECARNVGGFVAGPAGRISEVFPPVFGYDDTGAAGDDIPYHATNASTGGILAFAPADPFREVLRLTLATTTRLETVPGELDADPLVVIRNTLARDNISVSDGIQRLRASARKPLRFDRVIDRIDPTNGEPVYRELTPHPDLSRPPYDTVLTTANSVNVPRVVHTSAAVALSAAPLVPVEDPNIGISATTARDAVIQQEFWARQDRQNLARDIYVLAYTLCGPDGWNPAFTSPVGNAQAENHVRLCAQFAVNVVDALDRDSVVTEFSYDPDLSDGWDTTVASGADGSAGTGRVSVYGVEATTLSLSEVLLGRTQKFTADEASSSWDDSEGQQFAAIELRNSSPFDVDLHTNTFRIEVQYENPDVGGGTAQQAIVDFQHAGGAFDRTSTDFKLVRAGGNFLILDTTDLSEVAAALVDRSGGSTPDYFVLPKAPDGVTASNILYPATAPTGANAREEDIGIDLASTDPRHETFRNFAATFPDFLVRRPSGDPEHIVMPADTSGDAPTGSVSYSVRLWRRPNLMDPNRVLSNGNAAWVLVDEVVHESRDDGTNAAQESEVLDISNSNAAINDDTSTQAVSAATVNGDLRESWYSAERSQPFGEHVGPLISAAGDALHTSTATNKEPGGNTQSAIQTADLRKHTISSEVPGAGGAQDAHYGNSNLDPTNTTRRDAAFTTWHAHFDRDLLSPAELLSLPVVSTVGVTTFPAAGNIELSGAADQVDGSEDTLFRQLRSGASPGDRLVDRIATSGDTVRTMPNTLLALINSAGDAAFGNRWYRILDFVHVPADINGPLQAQDEQSGRDRFKSRTPGKINLNTMRHEQVLAGLIDEPTHLNPFDGVGVATTNGNLAARSNDPTDPTRNWWREFLFSRDGIDPFTLIPIPGVPGCKPFEPGSASLDVAAAEAATRSTARLNPRFSDDGTGQIEDRTTTPPGDLNELTLFEARDTADIGADNIDPWTRNRLLAKVMNNGTKRSNVFIIWCAIQLHEADHGWQPSGAPDLEDVRIGGPVPGAPIYRTFCIVDRTLLEQAYEDPDPTDGVPGTFDFRKFIIHRQRLR